MSRPIIAAPMAMALAISTSMATAPAAWADSIAVKFSDLDLDSPAGKAELSRRIDRAARAVCTSIAETGTIVHARVSQTCLARARSQAQQQVALKTGRDDLGG